MIVKLFKKKQSYKKQRNFITSKRLLIGLAVILMAALGWFAYEHYTQDSNVACKEQKSIKFCASAPAFEIQPTDKLVIEATLENLSDQRTYVGKFNTTCTDPSLVINDQRVSAIRGCGQALTNVEIGPGQIERYTLGVKTNLLQPGRNKIVLHWDKLTSGTLFISLKGSTAADVTKSEECFTTTEELPHCALISVLIKEEFRQTAEPTCEQLERHVKPLGLQAFRPDCSASVLGLISVSVPAVETEEWVAKLEQLEQVDAALPETPTVVE